MKNALLVVSTFMDGSSCGYKNMGDYIQSLAGEIFFNNIDEFINRENLANYKSETGKAIMIMNSWYMHFPDNWPPSDDIIPLLISMHITPQAAKKMFSTEGINYFLKYAPVGCRDKDTESLFNNYGIPCYFSGCLTLVLGEKYKIPSTHSPKKSNIIFVDPYFEYIYNVDRRFSITNSIKSLLYGIINIGKIKRLQNIFYHRPSRIFKIKLFMATSAFYKTYSSFFDDDLLFSAEYMTHSVKVGEKTSLLSEKDKIEYARNLINKYARASLVITSRIHCALPCLGLETPVIFIKNKKHELSSDKTRFGGIIDLFRVIRFNNFSLFSEDETIEKKITLDTVITNKETYIPIKNTLLKKCYEFTSQTHEQ